MIGLHIVMWVTDGTATAAEKHLILVRKASNIHSLLTKAYKLISVLQRPKPGSSINIANMGLG